MKKIDFVFKYNGIVCLISFENENKKIFYNLFNIGIVVLILIVILMSFFQNDFNSIVQVINAM